MKFAESYSVVSNSLLPHDLYSPENSPGQNNGVGSLSLLQGVFSTQGSNPALPHCRQILYQLCHRGSPRILEWVTYFFSSGSSSSSIVNLLRSPHTFHKDCIKLRSHLECTGVPLFLHPYQYLSDLEFWYGHSNSFKLVWNSILKKIRQGHPVPSLCVR